MNNPTLEALTKQAHELKQAEEQLQVFQRSIDHFSKGRREGTMKLAIQMDAFDGYHNKMVPKNVTFDTRPLVGTIVNDVLDRYTTLALREIELKLGVERHFASVGVNAIRMKLTAALRGAESIMSAGTEGDINV